MTARLLMVGIDGADGWRLDRCSADGSLPNLAALRASGRAHRLTAMPGSTDDALWASFQYGDELGEHGRYFDVMPLGDGRFGKAYWAEADRSTFWNDLSDQGMRVAVIDVPKCGNPRPLNGVHLLDWLVHGNYFFKPRSKPHGLAAEVVRRFGSGPRCRCGYLMPVLSDAEVVKTTDGLRATVAQKRAAGLHYLAAEPWDLFIIGFKEAHCACHTFWDFDPGHPNHDPARNARLGDPVTAVLRDIDEAIGDLVAAAGPSAEVVVFSTSDYAANGSLEHLAPGIVERLNAYLAGGGADQPPVDWRCSILPYGDYCVALHVARPRQAPDAAVGPPAPPDRRQLEAIEARLRELRDADTGEPAVAAITRPSSELKGARAASLPDLLIHCPSGRIPRAVVSPALGRIEAESPSRRLGNHVAGGFVVAAGTRARAGVEKVRTMAGFGALAKTILDGAAHRAAVSASEVETPPIRSATRPRRWRSGPKLAAN